MMPPPTKSKRIIFRMDDVGASSKKWEVYGKCSLNFGRFKVNIPFIANFLFLKYLSIFKGWGPYQELSEKQWVEILNILKKHQATMTVGITAGWVEKNGVITPFPEKYPKQAKIIKNGLHSGLLEVANHGLTHCVVGKHLPKFFLSNRKYHREFWDWVPSEEHRKHLETSQKILEDFFEVKIETFIPPGNVWTENSEKFAFKNGIRYISSSERVAPHGKISNEIKYISKDVFAFHDREISLYGIRWFSDFISTFNRNGFEIFSIKEYLNNKGKLSTQSE